METAMQLSTLLAECRRHPNATVSSIAANGTRQEMRMPDIAERAEEVGRRLKSAGIQRGHVVTLRGANTLAWVIWDLAVLNAGGILHAIPEDWSRETIREKAGAIQAALYVGDGLGDIGGSHCVGMDMWCGTDALPVRREATILTEPDVHSLAYSSGTSGQIKGIRISGAGTAYVISRFIESYKLNACDRHLIFLPFSNYQQRLSLYGCLMTGASVTMCEFAQAFHCIRSEKPTFVIAPPLFYSSVLQVAYRAAEQPERLRAAFGGDTRFLITGMAPIRRKVLDAYWRAGLSLLEAYGMTECGMIAWNTPDACRPGSVGQPLDRGHLTLATDGEIVVRREFPLSRGYFLEENSSDSQTFGESGVIATGDIGHYDADGYMYLDGRKKDLIVLSNGVKLHPNEIEATLRSIPEVTDAIALGTSHGDGIVGVIVVARDGDSSLESRVRAGVGELNASSPAHKRVSRLIFTTEHIGEDPRFLTRNMKLSRRSVFEYFRPQLEQRNAIGAPTIGSDAWR